jgi:hypothetical protein
MATVPAVRTTVLGEERMERRDIPPEELPGVIGALEGHHVELTIPQAGSTGVVVTIDGGLTDYGEQRKDGELQWFGFRVSAARESGHPRSGVIIDPAFVRSAQWTFDDEDRVATLVIVTPKVTLHLAVDSVYDDLRR